MSSDMSPWDSLMSAFDELVQRVTHLEERVSCSEGAWQRHGREVEQIKDRQSIHCERLQELDELHLHCGCGERLTSEEALQRAWRGEERAADKELNRAFDIATGGVDLGELRKRGY